MFDRSTFQGVIANYNSDRGFGFIRPDDRTEDLFFHISEVTDATLGEIPALGTRVTYDRRFDPKKGKTRALDVRAAESGAGDRA